MPKALLHWRPRWLAAPISNKSDRARLPYRVALAGLAVASVFPLRPPFPVVEVFSFDSFSDLVEAVLSFLSVVFFAVSFFFAGVVSAPDFFFSGVALGFGEAFFGAGFG